MTCITMGGDVPRDYVVFTDVDYTASRFDMVVCDNTSAISVTLPATPSTNDFVNIKRKGAVVTVVGQIDGSTNKVINVVDYNMKLIYDGTEWIEV